MKPRLPTNPQNLDELMLMAEDYAEFALRNNRQTPPTLIAATKRGPLYFTPNSLEDELAKPRRRVTAELVPFTVVGLRLGTATGHCQNSPEE